MAPILDVELVLAGRLPDREAMRARTERLANAFAGVCSRPRESVHILYRPEASGRIAFGRILSED